MYFFKIYWYTDPQKCAVKFHVHHYRCLILQEVSKRFVACYTGYIEKVRRIALNFLHLVEKSTSLFLTMGVSFCETSVGMLLSILPLFFLNHFNPSLSRIIAIELPYFPRI